MHWAIHVCVAGVSLVNGLGSVGSILQGGCVTTVLAWGGWSAVWLGCSVLCLVAALILRLSPGKTRALSEHQRAERISAHVAAWQLLRCRA